VVGNAAADQRTSWTAQVRAAGRGQHTGIGRADGLLVEHSADVEQRGERFDRGPLVGTGVDAQQQYARRPAAFCR
jgi:hypothetical protein